MISHSFHSVFFARSRKARHCWLDPGFGGFVLPQLSRRLTRRLKGQFHEILWFFALFFCSSKQWRLLAQTSRTSDHDTRSAAQTTSPPKLSRGNFVFRSLALWPPLFSPHKMAAKNHRLSWHCRIKKSTLRFNLEQLTDREGISGESDESDEE